MQLAQQPVFQVQICEVSRQEICLVACAESSQSAMSGKTFKASTYPIHSIPASFMYDGIHNIALFSALSPLPVVVLKVFMNGAVVCPAMHSRPGCRHADRPKDIVLK